MMLSALRQVVAAAADPGTIEVPTAVVVATGLTLVFAILLILIVIVLVEGKIFSSLDERKKEKALAKEAQAVATPAAPAPVAAPVAPAAAPAVQPGIPPEVVAAIAAAVSASSGGSYTLRAVSTAKKGRGQWGLAGVIQSTEPF